MNVLDPSIRGHINTFQNKVLFSKLNAGAKAGLFSGKPKTSPRKADRNHRKERLKRDAAAKAKLLQPGD